MWVQLVGALLRAFLIVIMIVTPATILSGVSTETNQLLTLISVFAFIYVLCEYGGVYPGLIEFRDAAPLNRVKFLMMFAMVFSMATALSGGTYPTMMARFFESIGILLGLAVDFPFSPIRAVMDVLPDTTSFDQRVKVRVLAGLAYLWALIFLTIFAILIRLKSWPSSTGSFNVWINLPTFDPTAGMDVILRLRRHAKISIALGVILPFISPSLAWMVGLHYGLNLLKSDHALIWMMTLWAFLPAAFFIRGIALHRVSMMLLTKRRQFIKALEPGDFPQSLVVSQPQDVLKETTI